MYHLRSCITSQRGYAPACMLLGRETARAATPEHESRPFFKSISTRTTTATDDSSRTPEPKPTKGHPTPCRTCGHPMSPIAAKCPACDARVDSVSLNLLDIFAYQHPWSRIYKRRKPSNVHLHRCVAALPQSPRAAATLVAVSLVKARLVPLHVISALTETARNLRAAGRTEQANATYRLAARLENRRDHRWNISRSTQGGVRQPFAGTNAYLVSTKRVVFDTPHYEGTYADGNRVFVAGQKRMLPNTTRVRRAASNRNVPVAAYPSRIVARTVVEHEIVHDEVSHTEGFAPVIDGWLGFTFALYLSYALCIALGMASAPEYRMVSEAVADGAVARPWEASHLPGVADVPNPLVPVRTTSGRLASNSDGAFFRLLWAACSHGVQPSRLRSSLKCMRPAPTCFALADTMFAAAPVRTIIAAESESLTAPTQYAGARPLFPEFYAASEDTRTYAGDDDVYFGAEWATENHEHRSLGERYDGNYDRIVGTSDTDRFEFEQTYIVEEDFGYNERPISPDDAPAVEILSTWLA